MADARSLIDPVREFLAAPRCAVLATSSAEGTSRQVVVHYTLPEDHMRLNGRRDRGWVTNLRRDPRAGVIVHDPDDYLHYVSIRGTVRVVEEGDGARADAMRQAQRYGEDPADFAGQSRVTFRLDPTQVHEYR